MAQTPEWIVGQNEAACAADAVCEVVERWLDPANQISRSLGSRDSYRVLAEAAPPS
jgi:hypothetical protein